MSSNKPTKNHINCWCDSCVRDEEVIKERMRVAGHWVNGDETIDDKLGDTRSLEEKLKDLF
jgi:hypothetical protein